jgi:hypothetical protein
MAPVLPGHPILVAFDRPALDRLVARCPDWLLDGLVVVTRGDDVPGVMTTIAIPAAEEQPLATLLAWRSAGSPFPSPIRWLRRLRKRARLQAGVLPMLAKTVEAGVAAAATNGESQTPLVLCLGGVDVVAAGPVVRSGKARFAPGGLRWLGDARWSSGAGSRAGATAGVTADAVEADADAAVSVEAAD